MVRLLSGLIIVMLLTASFYYTGAYESARSTEPTVEFLTPDNYFETVDQKGVVVVEFWARWNSEHEYPLHMLEMAEVYRVDIERYPMFIKQFEIESLPTIFIYKDGIIRHEDRGDITFKRSYDEHHLQEEIYRLIDEEG